MKFGIDIHGVVDSKSRLFAALTQALVSAGHEVHIITGPELTWELTQQLQGWGIVYTHFFSIVGYHKGKGTDMIVDDTGPHLDPYEWDKTKGQYCERAGIDLHFDDSDIYGYFFKTPYARFFSKDTHRVNKLKLS